MGPDRALLLVLLGCGAAPRDCPRWVATEAELRAAREHGMKAQATSRDSTSHPHVWDRPYAGRTWYPWFYYWDPDLERARLATAGIQETQALELEYRAACNGIPERARARSLLDAYAVGSRRQRDSVTLHLAAEVGPPEALLVGLRCHRAWIRLIPRADARDDLLAVDGVTVVVHAGAHDGVDVLLSSDDPAVLGEIERRARMTVARANRLRDVKP